MLFSLLAASASALAVSAANITVMVGQGGPSFTPANVTAQAGDIINFQFVAKIHSATQSTFVAPCSPMDGGIDSGLQNVSAITNGSVPQWAFQVSDSTTPLWFYCKFPSHCQNGMVFAVNANANKTFDQYLSNAKSSAANTTTGGSNTTTTGGTSTNAPAGSAGSTTGASASPSPSSNSAMRVGGSAAGALVLLGVVAGLM